MAKRNAEQCLAEGHRVDAQWSTWYSHVTELRKDSDGVEFVAVLTGTAKGMDDSDGDTEWWCSECGFVAAPPIVDYF